MKRKRLALIGALTVLACGLALAGCGLQRLTIQDLIEMGYVHCVTFDLQGGKSGERKELIQYVRDNSLVLEPGSSDKADKAPLRTDFTFNAFYRGTENADGTIDYGEEWDFAHDRVTSDITLYARWNSNYSFIVHYGENYEKTATVAVEQSSTGDAVPLKIIQITGATVIDVFTSKADAEAETDPIAFPFETKEYFSSEKTQAELWANTLDGVWKLIYTAEDFLDVRFGNNTNLYFMTGKMENKVLNLDGETVDFPASYAGQIEGNGVTLTNFRIVQERQTGSGVVSYGMFRRLREDAVIRNITFDHFTYQADLTNTVLTYQAGIFAGEAEKGATVGNVTLSHASFTFTFMPGDDDMERLFPDNALTLVGNGTLPENACTLNNVTLQKQLFNTAADN